MQGLLASLGVKGRAADSASSGAVPQQGQHWACVELNTEWRDGGSPRAPAPQLTTHQLGSKKLSKPPSPPLPPPPQQSKGSGLAPQNVTAGALGEGRL